MGHLIRLTAAKLQVKLQNLYDSFIERIKQIEINSMRDQGLKNKWQVQR